LEEVKGSIYSEAKNISLSSLPLKYYQKLLHKAQFEDQSLHIPVLLDQEVQKQLNLSEAHNNFLPFEQIK
jgi:hypothetical protein